MTAIYLNCQSQLSIIIVIAIKENITRSHLQWKWLPWYQNVPDKETLFCRHASIILFTYCESFIICEYIYENLPYGGTNIANPGQTPRTPEPKIFVTHEHLQQHFYRSLCRLTINTITNVWIQLVIGWYGL